MNPPNEETKKPEQSEESKKKEELAFRNIPQRLASIPSVYKKPNFVPLPIVIQILKSSSPQKELRILKQQCQSMDGSMNDVVNVYFEGFNKAIQSYSQIISHISNSQSEILTLETVYTQAKNHLNYSNLHLSSMWNKYNEYKMTLSILDDIQWLHDAPRLIESYISTDNYSGAASELSKAMKLLRDPKLLRIGCLRDISQDILDKKNMFPEIMLEKIHDFLYISSGGSDPSTSLFPLIDEFLSNQDGFLNTAFSSNESPYASVARIIYAFATLEELPMASHRIQNRIKPEINSFLATFTPALKDAFSDSDVAKKTEIIHTILGKLEAIICHHFFLSEMISCEAQKNTLASPFQLKYTKSMIWNSVQECLVRDLVSPLVRREPSTPTSPAPATTPVHLATSPTPTKLFSFSGAETSFYNQNEAHQPRPGIGQEKKPLLAYATPKTIVLLYPVLSEFCSAVYSFFHKIELQKTKTDEKHDFILEEFLDTFVRGEYLPFSKNECEKVLSIDDNSETLSSATIRPRDKASMPTADPRRFSISPKATPSVVLKSTVTMLEITKELYNAIASMPRYFEDFLIILESTLLRYFSQCEENFSLAIGSKSKTTLCGKILDSRDYLSLIESSLGNTSITPKNERRKSLDNHFLYEKEETIESHLFEPTFHFVPEQLIFDPQKLSLIAQMQHSFEWLSKSLEKSINKPKTPRIPGNILTTNPNKNQQGLGDHYLTSSSNNILLTPRSLETVDTVGGLWEEHHLKLGLKSIYEHQNVTETILGNAKKFGELSKTIIFALRLELRLHCIYYLSNIRMSDYLCKDGHTDPDPFVLDLNENLSLAKSVFSHYLSSAHVQVIFNDLPRLLSKILIRALRSIQDINQGGVRKMCRNIFALQQNLTGVIFHKEHHFDTARRYYELLNLTDEMELFSYISEHLTKNMYTLEDYSAILERNPDKKLGMTILNMLQQKM